LRFHGAGFRSRYCVKNIMQPPERAGTMGKRQARDPLKDIKSSRGKELAGRRVVLCVTGSVASIEVPALARELMRHGAEVNVVMSESAERLVRPETLEWATGNPVVRRLTGGTEHVRLAGEWQGRADLVLVAPCTANTLSKISLGIDDTPVTTLASMALGAHIPLVLCPAAHEPMYKNPAVAANLQRLKEQGVEIVGPRFEEAKAKMATVGEIVDASIRRVVAKDLSGKRIVVTGGPTAEFIDPVRVITNLSSGKMGLAIAREAWLRGAEVSYVFGGGLVPPEYIRSKRVVTTAEMRDAVMSELDKGRCDAFISAAAPADFVPESRASNKIRTSDGVLSLRLRPSEKIIEEVRRKYPKLYLVAFKAETTPSKEELAKAAKRFMKESGSNMVVANDVSGGKGFGADTNSVLIIQAKGSKSLAELPKNEIAKAVLDEVAASL
jgi:phosphopantothenoylcysteine decarboxylase/phosphopantothenate--cysteine ligase